MTIKKKTNNNTFSFKAWRYHRGAPQSSRTKANSFLPIYLKGSIRTEIGLFPLSNLKSSFPLVLLRHGALMSVPWCQPMRKVGSLFRGTCVSGRWWLSLTCREHLNIWLTWDTISMRMKVRPRQYKVCHYKKKNWRFQWRCLFIYLFFYIGLCINLSLISKLYEL